MDYVDARRLEQRHEVGQRAVIAHAQLVAPEPRQADRVGVHGVGQGGKGRRAAKPGRVWDHAGPGARERLDLEGVADHLGEQRRLEGARPRAAARHGAGRALAHEGVGRRPALGSRHHHWFDRGLQPADRDGPLGLGPALRPSTPRPRGLQRSVVLPAL